MIEQQSSTLRHCLLLFNHQLIELFELIQGLTLDSLDVELSSFQLHLVFLLRFDRFSAYVPFLTNLEPFKLICQVNSVCFVNLLRLVVFQLTCELLPEVRVLVV